MISHIHTNLAEATLHGLFNAAPDGILLVNQQGIILLANPRLEEMFGYEATTLIGQSIEILVPSSLREVHQQHRYQYEADPQQRPMGRGLGYHFEAQRQDGSLLVVEISLSPLQLEDGQQLTIAIVRDITARHEVEEHAKQLQQEQFARLEAESARRSAELSLERLKDLQLIFDALSHTLTYKDVCQGIMQHVVPQLNPMQALLFLQESDSQTWFIAESSGYDDQQLEFAKLGGTQSNGAVSEAIRSNEMVWAIYDSDLSSLWYSASLPVDHVVLGLALPLGNPLLTRGLLYMQFAQPRIISDQQLALIAALATQSTLALERAHLYAAESEARARYEAISRRQAFLSSASATLISTLNEQSLIQSLAYLVVEHLADACIIEISNVQGKAYRVIVEATDSVPKLQVDPISDEFGSLPSHHTKPTIHLFTLPTSDLFAQIGRSSTFCELLGQLAPCSAMTTLLSTPEQRRVVGSLTFCYTERSGRHYQQADIELMRELAHRIGMTLTHARLLAETRLARAKAEKAEQRARFLAEASAVLSASFDDNSVLQHFVQLALPRMADLCSIYLLFAEQEVELAALAHIDPAQEILMRSALHQRFPLSSNHPAAMVIRSQQAAFNPQVDVASFEQMSQQINMPELHSIPHSHIVVPLIAHQQVLGALSFSMHESKRQYGLADLALAEDLGQRAALAIENTRLYHVVNNALQTRDNFLSVAAHELKNPLSAMLGNVQLLARRMQLDMPINERHMHSLQVINEQTNRLHKLILTLLDLSQIQSGRLIIKHELVNLCDIVNWVITQIQPSLTQHTIHFDAPDHPLTVTGDAMRLEQVIHNLVNNAVKYSPDGGPILIDYVISPDQSELVLRIVDYGIGIPESELSRLFRLFYRASNVSEYSVNGLGIGLAIIKEIITLHNGAIDVSSVEGEGSTFSIRLPYTPSV
jgi:PAS domain S-box-containing protein